jgi:hypothetical protein
MATVTVSQQIAAPADQVFRLFTDCARARARLRHKKLVSSLKSIP